MADWISAEPPEVEHPQQGDRRPLYLIAASIVLIGVSGTLPDGIPALGTLALGVGIFLSALVLHGRSVVRKRGQHRLLKQVSRLFAGDPAVTVVADAEGEIQHFNAAAASRFQEAAENTAPETSEISSVAGLLRGLMANPASVVYRLQKKAEAHGVGTDTVSTRNGQVALSVHDIGAGLRLWRIEESRATATEQAETGLIPRVTVGRGGTILFMNAAARKLIGKRISALDRLSSDLPENGKVISLDTASGPVARLVSEVPLNGGRRELFFLPPPAESESSTSFDHLSVPLMKVSQNGVVTRANHEALKLLNAEEVTGKKLADLMEGLGRPVTDWLRDAAAGRGQKQSEFLRIIRRDREVFVQVVLNRVFEDGEPSIIAVLNDATELKTLEAQFVQSQKMQAIGQLAGGVAHDFNNLLTAISGHCDLLLLRHDQGDPNYGDLVQINQNANRAAALVGQLLAFSRKQTLCPEVLDLRDTLADLTHLLNRLVGEKVVLALDHDPVLRTIRADKRQLEQVLMNLVVNARDAMPEGGEIRITTEGLTLEAPLKRDRASVPPGEYVLVKVQDMGVGIAADMLQKVFEPFYTTKRTGEGTGLGLSTVYGIVKQTGGFIFVDSAIGKGTCFSLLFPVFSEKPAADAACPMNEEEAGSSPEHDAVILLVEDEAPVRAFASRALRMRGFKVLEAASAEEALDMLRDPEVEVDVFVTDVVMPGLDGPSWVRQALEDRPEVKVVFVSGYAQESFHDDQAAIPNSTFLPKPFSLVELTDTVQRQLH
ncbi:ATP-binding protein [Marinovum sp.]|uniref:ATP-binding protein n=1 Tax=Marinovum sp. TaxID=2024839 RepID=UPI002B2789A3|nr:ATP-binding protein [Marinovum sp.]